MKVLDADEGYVEGSGVRSFEPVTVNLGGKQYVARCPKMVWFRELTELRRSDLSTSAQLQIVELFLEHCFNREDSAEVRNRLRDDDDVLDVFPHLINAVALLSKHYQPMLNDHFDSMNIEPPEVDDEARAITPRKATAKTTASKGARKRA